MTLQSDIQAAIDQAGIEAGVSVLHIESGERVDINADQAYPMASVFKIPILVTAGRQLEAGTLKLADRITLRDEDKSAGSGILPFFDAGVSPTFRDLLTLMIIISDNTATDMTVQLLGGAAVVEGTMHELGLTDIHFKLNCKDLLQYLFPPEVRNLPLDELRAWTNENDILRDGVVFSRGADNNVSTASAMTELVRRLFAGEVVNGAIQEELLAIMRKQQYNQRLPRFLPQGTPFAHKTGTIAGFCNDSGVMTINDSSHAVVTAFTHWDDKAVWKKPVEQVQRVFEVESAIGRIGRLVYDYFGGN